MQIYNVHSFIDNINSELDSSNDIHNIEVTEAHDGQIDINLHQRRQDNSFTTTYSIITHTNPDTPPSIKMAEPCCLNPKSYKNVQEVMTHIKKKIHCVMTRDHGLLEFNVSLSQ